MNESRFTLYSRPTFLEGVSRLVDFGGFLNEYNYSSSDEEADYRALLSDWEAIGDDLLSAYRKFLQEYQENRLNG